MGSSLIDVIDCRRINITEPTAPIASQSTTRAHFKSWHSAPAQPFPEMPPVAGNQTLRNHVCYFSALLPI